MFLTEKIEILGQCLNYLYIIAFFLFLFGNKVVVITFLTLKWGQGWGYEFKMRNVTDDNMDIVKEGSNKSSKLKFSKEFFDPFLKIRIV